MTNKYLIAALLLLMLVLVAMPALTQPIGAEQAEGWYQWALGWLMRPAVGAILAGLLCSFVITQRWKMTLPADLDHDVRRRTTQRFSFIAGAVPTLLFWPIGWDLDDLSNVEIYLILVTGGVCAVLVGCVAPWSYAIVMNRLYKWGWLDEVSWSGEARARAKQDDKGQ